MSVNTSVWPDLQSDATGPRVRFRSSLSVFFPAFNDAPSLPSLLDRTFETLRRAATDFEVIVVNDGSTDETATVLEALRRQYAPWLRVVTHERNMGYGAALRSGLAAATKEYVFYTDGDGQYDPAELEKLLDAATPETGLVNGYKLERSDPWHRVAIGWLYNRFARWLFRIRLRDIDCDFRLIRRDVLNPGALRSTGGTICVELVRMLELSGAGVVEVPVHHYARQHGRSQFFRVRSLALTFLQLCSVYFRLVLAPSLRAGECRDASAPSRFSRRKGALVALAVVALAVLAYARALTLPFIADDYVQIQLARDYGPVSKWGALAGDALYRCRATSLVLTYWLERAVGLAPFYYNALSLLIHIANSLLVLSLGFWRPVGWRIAAPAACYFAVSQRHSEAVVWFAAVPELLVFFFVVAGFLFWVRSLEARSPWPAYVGAVLCYLLALLSKESAVMMAPLCALAVFAHPRRPLHRLWGLVPFGAMAALYFVLGYSARATHLHFNDGTFSLSAPFIETLARSTGRLMWVWGVLFLPLLVTRMARPWRRVLAFSGIWMVIALLPYSFLTYMPRVPSRHTYLASVGIALIVATGLVTLRRWATVWDRLWLVPSVACLIVAHQCGYLWTVKHRQYADRARPTENLVRLAEGGISEIRARCFPYSTVIGQLALSLRLGEDAKPKFIVGEEAARGAQAVDLCTVTAWGVRY